MGDDCVVTWDVAFSKMANRYLADSDVVERAKAMRNNEIENKLKFDEIKEQINSCFKQQNNIVEELIGVIMKQNNNAEVLQKLQSVERQNENISLSVKTIQEFNILMNDDYKELITVIKSLLSKIIDMSFLEKLRKK